MLLFSAISVSAFTVESEEVNTEIFINQTAEVRLIVRNDADFVDKFRISTGDFDWSLSTDPLSDYLSGFTVRPGEEKEVRLFLDPSEKIFTGITVIKQVRIEVESQVTGTSQFEPVRIEIKSDVPPPPREYVPIILLSGDVNKNGQVDPRRASTVTITLDNRNRRNHPNLTVEVESEFLTDDLRTSLEPLEKKNLEFTYVVDDPLEPPKNTSIFVRVTAHNYTIANDPRITIPIEIIAYSDVNREEVVENNWFKYKKNINILNDGNIGHEEIVRVETNWLKSLFTSTSPKARTLTESGVTYLEWDISLVPQGVVTLNITVNYRPVFYVIFGSILLISLYYLLRSPLIVKKQAINIQMYEGGISEMKILIHLKNRTANTYNTLVLAERVPKIADYVPSDSMGNILPSKVLRHEKKGTMLKWKIEVLDPFEERIIIYKIKAKLTILGRFLLPATIAKFKDEGGGDYVVHSNKLKITNLGKEDSEDSK
ncbi:MAG: hypothetical protein ACLFUO_06935 [Candidatus Woesearchaeota archaeon]